MSIFRNRLSAVVSGALVLALGVGVAGMSIVGAQEEAQGEVYSVIAGGSGAYNTDVLAFSPASIQIHRGDTVTWTIAGFHNIHIGDEPAELLIMPVVDGQPVPQLDPAIAYPSIENGGVYTGGDVGSGLPQGEATFSLTFDVEPGTYVYFCDIHPGMTGTIEVVADDVEIPSPGEVLVTQGNELTGHVQEGIGAGFTEFFEHAGMEMQEGGANVIVGTSAHRTSVNMFYPATVVINAGESVTWTLEAENIEPHNVSGAAFEGQDFVPQEQPDGPPLLLVGPGLLGTAPTGTEVSLENFNTIGSGFLLPGQTYSLTFTEPGVYNYVCTLHPGMNGTIVVLPA